MRQHHIFSEQCSPKNFMNNSSNLLARSAHWELFSHPTINESRTTPYKSKVPEGTFSNDTSRVVIHYPYKNPLSVQAHRVIASLKEFSALQENWDSYGAERISNAVIADAVSLVKKLDALRQEVYFVAPGPNGELSLELENKTTNRSLEILVYPDKQWKYLRFEAKDFISQGSMTIQDIRSHWYWLNGR